MGTGGGSAASALMGGQELAYEEDSIHRFPPKKLLHLSIKAHLRLAMWN
jgi:hypothetical protein